MFTHEYIKWKNVLFDKRVLDDASLDEALKIGFMNTEKGVLIIASRPIIDLNLSQTPLGTLVMGRFITPTYHAEIKDLTQNDFNIYTRKDIMNSEEKSEIFTKLIKSGDQNCMIKDNNNIIIYKILEDLFGEPVILLEASMSRAISQYGSKTNSTFRINILVFIIIITIILIVILENVITKPIQQMTGYLKSIQSSGDTSKSLSFSRKDEIGFLSDAVDKFVGTIDSQKAELEFLNDELKKQASTDALTGLFNRHMMGSNLVNLWNTMARDQSSIAIILLDIDYFKKYNDKYGHQQGDECLKSVAKLIIASLHREADIPIRYGGEEFLVILPLTDVPGAVLVAENIKNAIEKEKIEHENSEIKKHLTISVGVAGTTPTNAINLDDLIEQADKALYKSKEEGRNRITVYTGG